MSESRSYKKSTLSYEDNVVALLRFCLAEEQLFVLDKSKRFANQIRNSLLNRWEDNWIRTDGEPDYKADPTPDYFNDKEQLMMEVFRIDHYGRIDETGKFHNPSNENISELLKELNQSGFEEILKDNVIISAIKDDDGSHNYGYEYYLSSFTQTFNKHKSKIGNHYQKNHPGYRLIFLIMDESAGYWIADKSDPNRPLSSIPLDELKFRIHDPLDDEAFNSQMVGSDIDMIIWFAPYKCIFTNIGTFSFPKVRFYNPLYKFPTKTYAPECMRCMESKDSPMKSPSIVWKDGKPYIGYI